VKVKVDFVDDDEIYLSIIVDDKHIEKLKEMVLKVKKEHPDDYTVGDLEDILEESGIEISYPPREADYQIYF